MREITVSLSSSPLIPAVLANYDFSPISRIVNVDREQNLPIAKVFAENSIPNSLEHSTLTSKVESAGNINTKNTAILNRRRLPGCVERTTEVQPLTEAKKKRIINILRNCHSSMSKNDKLLLLATVFTNSVTLNNQQSSSKWLDLAVFLMTGGRERRETEYQKLLTLAGFKLIKIVNTQSSISAIEAVKV